MYLGRLGRRLGTPLFTIWGISWTPQTDALDEQWANHAIRYGEFYNRYVCSNVAKSSIGFEGLFSFMFLQEKVLETWNINIFWHFFRTFACCCCCCY